VRHNGTKWVLKNKKDERGIVVRNKARLVAQGHTQKEMIDYDEVFAPVAPRARYGTLSKYLLMNSFQMGTIDQTLFIRRQREDFILVQVYVDDIIFGSSNPQLCREFEALMHEKFQMSAMGKGLNLEKEQVKKQKLSEEAPEIETSTKEFTEEKMKEMMQLVPVKDVYVQALQVKHPIIDWKVYTEGQRSYWQIIRLGGSSACYQFFVDLLKQLDREDLN
nr:retrotransposon protein, putative, unclassified [Tanacetum cinerariifolium]